MTKANVFQLGLVVFFLGGAGYEVFRFLGFESLSAGIAAQSLLILIVLGWTMSYLFRVFTGKMTFVEQRKRYRKSYDEITQAKIKEKFDSMSEEEQIALLEKVEKENN